jgi:hypothetical protein
MQHDMSRNDWQTLTRAPLWILSAVAGRSGQFHPLEEAAFWQCVEHEAVGASGLTGEVLASVILAREATIADFERDTPPAASGLCAVVRVLDRLPAPESARFRLALMTLATGLAHARGPFGEVSRDDAETLMIIGELLEVETDRVYPLHLASPL